MVGELRTAIACGGLQLHYQPQINLRLGTAEAVEALVRWEHPTLGKLSPSEFVAIAESTDLIRPLTEFTLSEALAQAARWRRAGLELRVAVNLSARMLHDPELARRLATLLAASGVDPASLEVEITESAVMLDPPRALRIVREYTTSECWSRLTTTAPVFRHWAICACARTAGCCRGSRKRSGCAHRDGRRVRLCAGVSLQPATSGGDVRSVDQQLQPRRHPRERPVLRHGEIEKPYRQSIHVVSRSFRHSSPTTRPTFPRNLPISSILPASRGEYPQ
jgi:hypothetical protein